MKANVIILPMALGLVALAATDVQWKSSELNGVVAARNTWMILTDGDGYHEILMHGEALRKARRWQGNRGEPMVFKVADGLRSGMLVSEGQEMAHIFFPLEQYRYESALADLKAAQTSLAEMEAGPRSEEMDIAEATLAMAELEILRLSAAEARASSLLTHDLLSYESYESSRSELLIAQEKARVLQAELNLLLNGITEEERTVAQAGIEICAAKVAQAAALAETTVIRSPHDGIVTEGPGDCVIAVSEQDTVFVYLPIDQETAMDMTPGTRVCIKGPGAVQGSGEIVATGQSAQVVGNQVAMAATVLLFNPGARLKPGMTVVARIEAE